MLDCLVGQVAMTDASGNEELSAVQADKLSTYQAEGTSFVGFVGEVRVIGHAS